MESTCSGKPPPGMAPGGATGHGGRTLRATEGNQAGGEFITGKIPKVNTRLILGVRDGDSWKGLSLSAE